MLIFLEVVYGRSTHAQIILFMYFFFFIVYDGLLLSDLYLYVIRL